MKMITDYFNLKQCGNPVEEVVQTDDEEVYYEARKIKIRLADPNIPDSYVCEIYDTSVEEAPTEHVCLETTAPSNETPTQNQNYSKRKARNKRLRNKIVSLSSSDEDESLITIRKRLRSGAEASNNESKTVKKSLSENVLRPTNPEASSQPKSKGKTIGDYFSPKNKLVSKGNANPTKKSNQENVKSNIPLAPIFRKAAIKPKEDAEVLKARRSFLNSGLPKKTKRAAEALKVLEETHVPFFPNISHIQQKSDEMIWTKRHVDLKLKDLEAYREHPLIWNTTLCLKNSLSQPVEDLKTVKTKTIDRGKLKEAYKNVNIDALYKALESKHDLGDKFSVWSEKFQPTSATISKEKAITKLKMWLTSWKRFEDFPRNCSKAGDSSDDFVSSDDEGSQRRQPPTACLLQGPVGCGKTAVVRALATELDFHVLEINSSSKRSGKKMLADLQEATKSHKILQEADGNMLKVDAMTVIVIEEADVVFDQDEGFVSGLQTLIATAKRPVLMLTNDATVQHLERFNTRQTLKLNMKRPQLSWSCAILELIALLEGAYPPRSSLSALLNKNNCDLRKSILELQFWVQMGGKMYWDKLSAPNLTLNGVWWSEKCEPKQQTSSFSNYCDNLSVCDLARRKTIDGDFYSKRDFIKDSCSLEENMMGIDKLSALQDEIEIEILRLSSLQLGLVKQSTGEPAKVSCNRLAQNRAVDELLQLVPKNTTRRDSSMDYLPTLRDICRFEKQRQQNNVKRGKRFFHYLQISGTKPTSPNLDINCSIFTTPLE